MGKGYPMGYRHIPLFLQCMFGTGAFEDLYFLFIRDPLHTGVSQETRKENTCTGLCMKDLCVILLTVSKFYSDSTTKMSVREQSKCPVGSDRFSFITDRRGQQCLCAHCGQIEDNV